MTMNRRSYAGIPRQVSVGSLRHGLNSYAPLKCNGYDCPYRETCDTPNDFRIVGKPCAIESVLVSYLTSQYSIELQVATDDIARIAQVHHLVNLDIKLRRCNNLFAANPQLVITTYDEFEQPRKKLNPIARYELLLMYEHNKVLNKLRQYAR